MYASLKGRYSEYIKDQPSEDLLIRPRRPSSNMIFAEEHWAKREDKRHKVTQKTISLLQ